MRQEKGFTISTYHGDGNELLLCIECPITSPAIPHLSEIQAAAEQEVVAAILNDMTATQREILVTVVREMVKQ